MAKVIIERDKYGADLPDVCIKCGADATAWTKRTFSWAPGWTAVFVLLSPLIYILVALALRKQCRLEVPFCEKHHRYWSARALYGWLSFFAAVAVGCAASAAISLAVKGEPAADTVFGMGFIAFVLWLIVVVVVSSGGIQVTSITNRSIRLTGVSRDFADAYEDLLDREEERRFGRRGRLDDEAGEHWRARRPEGPPRRKEKPDDDRYYEE